MMKFLCIGDPHFKVGNSLQTDALHKKSVELVINNKDIKFVVIMGDTLDSFEKINTYVWNRVCNWINDLSSLDIHLFILIGNHDIPNNSLFMSDVHVFKMVSKHNVTIVDKPIRYDKFLFLPYTPPGRFGEALSLVPDLNDVEVIFAHQEFKGSKLTQDGTLLSSEGDVWPLESKQFIISGHLHDYHKSQDNILYVGTPYTINFTNINDENTVSLFDYKDLKEERISLDIPMKHTIKLTVDEFIKYDFSKIKCVSGSLIKVIISGDQSENIIMKDAKVSVLIDNGFIVKFAPNKKVFIQHYKVERGKSYIDKLISILNEDDDLREYVDIIFKNSHVI